MAGCHHIVNRGVEQRDIFLEPSDYEKFLEIHGSTENRVFSAAGRYGSWPFTACRQSDCQKMGIIILIFMF